MSQSVRGGSPEMLDGCTGICGGVGNQGKATGYGAVWWHSAAEGKGKGAVAVLARVAVCLMCMHALHNVNAD
eukprot:1158446-Pelagomonas_calceolata.AAC.5